jgi:hypothetical protein|eukprot:COSAG01_NODE_871_length_13024_cov_115.041925_2_plen_233_part_00
MGGAVNGGQVHGDYPTDLLQLPNGGLNIGRGRMVPTTPWEGIWYPVAKWMGVTEGLIPTVLPNINRWSRNSHIIDPSAMFTGYVAPLPCDEWPCQHGGSCSPNGTTSYSCSCPAGYTGTDCELNVDDCLSSPCQNSGVCADGVNQFQCVCASGFSGDLCAQGSGNSPSPPSTYCSADTNADISVDTRDVLIVLSVFGHTAPPGSSTARADLDDSGTIDVNDILLVLGAFGLC